MSTGVKRTAAPPAPGGSSPAPKKAADVSNGKTPAPLTYSSGEPADDVNMNEVDDKVTLDVVLPSGQSKTATVDSNIPMLDLLVHLAATCKVSPSGHVLQVRDEETGKELEFKANQTIGSLGVNTVYLLPKNKKPDWSQAAKTAKAAKAFERTNRFTINLPGGQKAVMRISPQLTLGQVLSRVCQDKSLDSNRYTLQHPTHPNTPLNLSATIADSKLSEINLIHASAASPANDTSRYALDHQRSPAAAAAVPAARAASPSAASQDPSSWYMPGSGETKKKKGFLSFLSKKDKKFKLQEAHSKMETSSIGSPHTSSTVAPRRPSTPPPERRSHGDVSAKRPQTMYVTSTAQDSPKEQFTDSPSSQHRASPKGLHTGSPKGQATHLKDSPQAPARGGGGGKKRPAPPPPQAKTAVSEDVIRASATGPVAASAPPASTKHSLSPNEAAVSVSVSVKSGAEVAGASRLHSRNSSDSSGYHELTLSGAESPEASHLPTTFKTSIDTTSIDSCDNLNGDSGIQDMSPASDSGCRLGGEDQQNVGRAASLRPQANTHTADTIKPAPSTKKKKAPPPPKAKPAPVQEETSEVVTIDNLPSLEMPDASADSEEPPPPPSFTVEEVPCEEPPPPLTQTTEEPVPSLKLNLDFLEETDTDAERKVPDTENSTARTDTEPDSSETFDLNDILDGLVFDEEPRRSTTVTTTTNSNSSRKMAMVETASVASEEVEMVDDIRSRPCEFIPPPPPDEPPPEDYTPRGSGLRYADKSTVVGEDNISLPPASVMNSPVATRRRYSDWLWDGSVGSESDSASEEDLSLLLQQTIAAAQEALDRLGGESGEPSPRELGGRSSELSAEGDRSPSPDTSLSLPDLDMDNNSDSSARQERYQHMWDLSHYPTSSGDPSRASPSLDADANEALDTVDGAFAMTEEISAPLETVPPPLQFKNEEEKEEEEEEEEEEFVTVTEEYIVPVGPTGLDFSTAVKVSEEETRVQSTYGGGTERTESERVSTEQQDVVKRDVVNQDFAKQEHVKQDRMKQEHVKQDVQQPAVKEEFVLTMEDLSSVSLVPLRPRVYTKPKPTPAPAPAAETECTSEVTSSGSPQRSRLHLAYVSDHGHVQPVSQDTVHMATEQKTAFQHIYPTSEPALMAEEGSSSSQRYRSTAKLTMGAPDVEDVVPRATIDGQGPEDVSRSTNGSTPSPGGAVVSPGAADLQQQYNMLQQQFSVWQQQLQQNQTLLASRSGGSAPDQDETLKTLQLQMQMQQQMMEQLQLSMQALTLQQQQQQQQQQSPHSGEPAPSLSATGVQVTVTPPPPPSAPANTNPVSRASKTSRVKTMPISSRIQTQLDPREELMIAVRSFGGISGLKTVPVRDTNWVSNIH